MNNRPFRRKVIVIVLLCLAVLGAVQRHFATPGTTARDIGTLMLLLWIPVIGNVIAWLISRLKRPGTAADALAPADIEANAHAARRQGFQPHVTADITLRPAAVPAEDHRIGKGEYRCAFVVDNQGFSAIWRVDAGVSFRRGSTQRLAVEFLAPALALPRFAPGTAFRMLEGESFVGDGRVVAIAGGADGAAAIPGMEPAKAPAE
jgi:hypothetical protein